MDKLYSSYHCYCGFRNVVAFKKPTALTKAWLESDCLKCGARYDIRIYPHENLKSVNVHKRLITSSAEVDEAIKQQAKNEVINGEERNQRTKDSESH